MRTDEEQLLELLRKMEKERVQLIFTQEKKMEASPVGNLKVIRNKSGVYYAQIINSNGKQSANYLKKDNYLVQGLAQKGYDHSVLVLAREQLIAIQKILCHFPDKTIPSVYDNLSKERKELVKPVILPDDVLIVEWKKEEYERLNSYATEKVFVTKQKERVRSKSEVLIANQLFDNKIPYRYEARLNLKGFGAVHPDFTILDIKTRKIVYWEHLGMMDNLEYLATWLQKIRAYEMNGIFVGERLIVTMESSRMPLNIEEVELLIKHYLVEG